MSSALPAFMRKEVRPSSAMATRAIVRKKKGWYWMNGSGEREGLRRIGIVASLEPEFEVECVCYSELDSKERR